LRAPSVRARWALACTIIVALNAVVWALVTPSGQVPDEPQHVAYVQYVAETDQLPHQRPGTVFSDEESVAFGLSRLNSVIGNPNGRPPWTVPEDAAIERALARGPSRVSQGGINPAANNPPLYYLVQAGVSRAAGGDFWTRLLAMRLVSALMMGLTCLFAFAFLRELLPRAPEVWAVGALAAGLAPVAGFIGGSVNNDVGIALAGTATLWALARAFARGLNWGSGALVGVCFGLGVVTKVNVVGLAPGLLVAGAVLVRRQWHRQRREALLGLAAAAGVIALPIVLYLVSIHTVWDRPLWRGSIALGDVGVGATPAATHASFREMLSYLWQFYLPRLPTMTYHPHFYGFWDVWFTGWIGRFGWLDTSFPSWVYTTAGVVWIGLVGLFGRGLWLRRHALARRGGEVATYVVLAAGLLVLIGVQGYRYHVDTGLIFEQPRYLLPLLGLYAAFVAVALLGAGRRALPVVAAVVVSLTLVLDLGGLILTLGRFYA
jgi:4-amino-4-deoxy-L-arabinose transferase-like glycosyltransferase